MKINREQIRLTGAHFHGVILGKQAIPLGQIDLPVTFGDRSNFQIETLTFEVVDFNGSYHAILRRPCYAKFMAVLNYVYLKLKMPRPKDVITIGPSFPHARLCNKDKCQLTSKIIAKADLAEIKRNLALTAPESNKSTDAATFQSAKETKEVDINDNSSTKMPCVATV